MQGLFKDITSRWGRWEYTFNDKNNAELVALLRKHGDKTKNELEAEGN